MSTTPKPRKPRSDGWTAERQLRFLDALASSRNVRSAAAFAGMSRESAYHLRNRTDGTLFALLWDRALGPDLSSAEVHTPLLTNGRLMRLLGPHYRRESHDYSTIARKAGEAREP
jgi:hypothetical protein